MTATERLEAPVTISQRPPLTGRMRLGGTRLITGLAVLLVWLALLAPDRLSRLRVGAFLRIPIEGLALVALGLVLPAKLRRIVAITAGMLLGLLTIAKVLDVGYFAALDRPFDPVGDWSSIGPAIGVLRDSVGTGWADVAAVGVLLLVLAVVALVALSVVRLMRFTARHRAASARTVGALGIAWILCAVLGVQAAPGERIASTSTAGFAYDQVHRVSGAVADQRRFAAALTGSDRFRNAPVADLLTGLRGKDVVFAFVESYGRVAVQDTAFSSGVDEVLKSGTASLRAAGFSARSAFLTSPTFGGISWLAHSTLQSGLWVNSQLRYNQLVSSDRYTLSDAFKRAGWRTVADVPSNTQDWQQGTSFYHYDTIYDSRNVGYAGPKFSYATMPDEYVLSAFQRLELAKAGRQPVMAEIDLVSSHTPWAPLPRLVDWDRVGNGAIFDGMPAEGQSPSAVWRNSKGVQAAYGQSVQYTLNSLITFVQHAHDDNLVLVLLGDHQPATIVSGTKSGHDVPITIIAHDPAVLDRISSWGWQDGMLPDPHAPVWPMDTFRNRFLTAYRR
jgi:hypothetical protein